MTIPTAQTDPASRMTALERRASFSLASVYAMRMLGLFMVLPVFALEAARLPGGDDPARVGLAMGIYGLTQGLLQIPFGMASDRYGRKRVISTSPKRIGRRCNNAVSWWWALTQIPSPFHFTTNRAGMGLKPI